MDIFQYGTPEECGVKSEWIQKLLDDLDRHHLMMHSVLLARKGKIFAEGSYAPFKPNELHRMYSVSKSFAASAIGALIGEGKVALTDRITKFFPDCVDETLQPYLAEATVRDLLCMETPFDTTTYTYNWEKNIHAPNWVRSFFEAKTTHPAGSFFRYDTSASYMLGVIAERVTGKKVLEYLRDTVLQDTEFSADARCLCAPEGYSWCGSAVLCTPKDMARLAQVYLNGGKVNGKQVLPAQYVYDATHKQVSNCEDGAVNWIEGHGYGYQIWCTYGNGFAFNGMGCQFAFCFPEQELLFVCTADNQGNGAAGNLIYSAVWNDIVEKVTEPLPEAPAEQAKLTERLAHLKVNMPIGAPDAAGRAEIDGKWFTLNENPMKISRLMLEWHGETGIFHYVMDGEAKQFPFGTTDYAIGQFPQTNYNGDVIGTPSGRMFRCMSAGTWVEAHKFQLRTYIIDDYFGNFTATFGFKGDQLGLCMEKTAEWFLDEYKGIAGGVKEA